MEIPEGIAAPVASLNSIIVEDDHVAALGLLLRERVKAGGFDLRKIPGKKGNEILLPFGIGQSHIQNL